MSSLLRAISGSHSARCLARLASNLLSVAVRRASSGGGYTGSLGHEVWAEFGKDALHVVGFTSYNTPKAIPTALRLPCNGAGAVMFTTCFGTLPCASNARDDVVHVTFENIAK